MIVDFTDAVDALRTDFAAALTNPIAYLSSLEKHSQQLAILEDNYAEVSQCCGFTNKFVILFITHTHWTNCSTRTTTEYRGW